MNENNPIDPTAVPQSPLKPVENIPAEASPLPYAPADIPAPTVIIPAAPPPEIPVWFYLVFSLSLLLFVGVTLILAVSFLKKKPSTNPGSGSGSIPTIAVPTPTENPRSQSDELDDIEADVLLIDFSELGRKVTELENQSTVSASL